MITDKIGRYEVLLPINWNYDEIWETHRPSVFINETIVNLAKPASKVHSLQLYKQNAYASYECSNRAGDNQLRSNILS